MIHPPRVECIIHHCKRHIRIIQRFKIQFLSPSFDSSFFFSIPLIIKLWKEEERKGKRENIGTFVHYSRAEASIIEAKYKATRLFHKSDDK